MSDSSYRAQMVKVHGLLHTLNTCKMFPYSYSPIDVHTSTWISITIWHNERQGRYVLDFLWKLLLFLFFLFFFLFLGFLRGIFQSEAKPLDYILTKTCTVSKLLGMEKGINWSRDSSMNSFSKSVIWSDCWFKSCLKVFLSLFGKSYVPL